MTSFVGLDFREAAVQAYSGGLRPHFLDIFSQKEYTSASPPDGCVVFDEEFSGSNVLLYVGQPQSDVTATATDAVAPTVLSSQTVEQTLSDNELSSDNSSTNVTAVDDGALHPPGWYPITDTTLKYWDGVRWCWPEYDRKNKDEIEPPENTYIMDRQQSWIYLVWKDHTFTPADGMVNNSRMVEMALYNIDTYGGHLRTKDDNFLMSMAKSQQKVRDRSLLTSDRFVAYKKVPAHWSGGENGNTYFWDGKKNRTVNPSAPYPQTGKKKSFRLLENVGGIMLVCGIVLGMGAIFAGGKKDYTSGNITPSAFSIGLVVFAIVLAVIGWTMQFGRWKKSAVKKWGFSITSSTSDTGLASQNTVFVTNKRFADEKLKAFAEEAGAPIADFSENSFDYVSCLAAMRGQTKKDNTGWQWANGQIGSEAGRATNYAVGDDKEKVWAIFIPSGTTSTSTTMLNKETRSESVDAFWVCSYVLDGTYALPSMTITHENMFTRFWGKFANVDRDTEWVRFNKNFVLDFDANNHPLLEPNLLTVLNDAHEQGYDYYFYGNRLVVVSSAEYTDIGHLYSHTQQVASAIPQYLYR